MLTEHAALVRIRYNNNKQNHKRIERSKGSDERMLSWTMAGLPSQVISERVKQPGKN